jgi:hypothetical protein
MIISMICLDTYAQDTLPWDIQRHRYDSVVKKSMMKQLWELIKNIGVMDPHNAWALAFRSFLHIVEDERGEEPYPAKLMYQARGPHYSRDKCDHHDGIV